MRKMLLNPIEDVQSLIEETFSKFTLNTEKISIVESEHRMIAETIYANMTIPQYRKSTVDGYAIKCSHKSQKLKLVDAVEIENPKMTDVEGACIYVPTGGRVPNDADVMVKIEETNRQGNIISFKPYPIAENIIEVGDDMDYGDCVIKENKRLNAFDIGAMAVLGFTEAKVYVKPTVSILVSGNELVDIGEEITDGQTRDINGTTLTLLAKQFGFEVLGKTLVDDTFEHLKHAIEEANDISDLVIVSGGSSMGKFDFTHDVIDDIGQVLSYGIAMKPGKPTIIGEINNKPVIGLPGHPVSAVMVFRILMASLSKVFKLKEPNMDTVPCTLKRDVRPAQGRDTYQMVSFEREDDELFCVPTSGKSGMITLLTKSAGYFIIPKESTLIEKTSIVDCYIF